VCALGCRGVPLHHTRQCSKHATV